MQPLHSRRLFLALPLLAVSSFARPIAATSPGAPGASWLNGELRQLVRGTLITGASPKHTAVTAKDLKETTSVSPFAAMNAGLDPVSSDCLCLRPGNPALNGRGSLGRSRYTAGSRSQSGNNSVNSGSAAWVDRLLSGEQQVFVADSLVTPVNGSRLYEPARFALAPRDNDSSGSRLSLASSREAGRIAGGSMFGAGSGFGSAQQTSSSTSWTGGGATAESAGESSALSLGVFESATPDSRAIQAMAVNGDGLVQIERQWLAQLNRSGDGYTVGRQEMMANSLRFYAAVSRQNSGDVSGAEQGNSAFYNSGANSDSSANAAAASLTSTIRTASAASAAFEPELARSMTSTFGIFDSARTSAPRAGMKDDDLALLRTTASGADVTLASSAPSAGGDDRLFVAAVDDGDSLTIAAVPEPSNFAMAVIATLLLVVGTFRNKKAS